MDGTEVILDKTGWVGYDCTVGAMGKKKKGPVVDPYRVRR